MQECIDAYRKIQELYDRTLTDMCEQVQLRADYVYTKPDRNGVVHGVTVWKTLLGDIQTLYKDTMARNETAMAVAAFQSAPGVPTATVVSHRLTESLIEFTRLFVKERVAEKSEAWEKVRSYYANPAHGEPDALYADLKDVYDRVDLMLAPLKEIVLLMQQWKDLLPNALLNTCEAELDYWYQVVGQWFNYVCNSITQASPSPAPVPAATGAGTGAGTAATTARAAARTAATAERQPSEVLTAGSADAWHSPTAATGPALRRPPMMPVVKKARSRSKKSALGRRFRETSALGRLFPERSRTLADDHAEEIANAVKYNAMLVQLLLRRIRRDLTDPEGSLSGLHAYAVKKKRFEPAYIPVIGLQGRLRTQLDTAEELLDAYRRLGPVIHKGRNSTTLQYVADAAADLNIQLVTIARLIDGDIAKAASLHPAITQQGQQGPPATMEAWYELRAEFDALSEHSHRTGAKCRNIVNRINKVVADEDFRHKYLSYQSVERVTGWQVRQDPINPACLTTIETALIQAQKRVRRLKPDTVPSPAGGGARYAGVSS